MHLTIESTPSPDELGYPDHRGTLLFAFYENNLLVKATENSLIIPAPDDPALHHLKIARKRFIGIINGHPSYTAELTEDTDRNKLPENFTLIGLRQLYCLVEDHIFWAAGRAFQIMNWDRDHQFCGRCGGPTQDKTDEIAKICPSCGYFSYPTMAPAVIVAVTKGNQILLARNKQRPFKFYSVIAGFVESGESLEDCVKREVLEEVGIRVNNISYFKSQPWPFPNSLMIGFTAEYESGEIQVDGKEISHAAWFTKEELPEIPGSISIAWHLIQWFIKGS
jgi:NAD+ diphosphatase